MTPFEAHVHVEERHGFERAGEAVRIAVPFPRGALESAEAAAVCDAAGSELPSQSRSLARWADGSVRWLLVDFVVSLPARGRATVTVKRAAERGAQPAGLPPTSDAGGLRVRAGDAELTFAPESGDTLLARANVGGAELLAPAGVRLVLRDANGGRFTAVMSAPVVEETGPVRSAIVTRGRFVGDGRAPPLEITARWHVAAASNGVRLELCVRNPRAARHVGNLWDLGDAGSCRFADLSLEIALAKPVESLRWYAEDPRAVTTAAPVPWKLYQDSSGGPAWNSQNHVDHRGRPTVSFAGYEIVSGDSTAAAARGARATPGLRTSATSGGAVGVSVEQFWQNFPKALRFEDGRLAVALFPAECSSGFELQGGEQKTHTVLLDLGAAGSVDALPLLQAPLAAWVEPEAVERSGAVAAFTPAAAEPDACARYVATIVEGEHAFAARREVIDEYGWRNFGDLYADHEAVREPAGTLISHYNNQYDFVLAAGVHWLRSGGNERWLELLRDAARHTIDIDIYHTTEDRPAYSGGLFWHTDHHRPAATSTHRTYSRKNGPIGRYGGGPSNEHNYTSGLLLYYWLTGDGAARDAVIGLADWVVAMDDGARTWLSLLDEGPTGKASCTVSPDYHKPGRGAGNSINALLDAYAACGDRRYMTKAEELLRRCIHPRDDVDALRLDEPEYRWSYLVFLQTLGKFLDVKAELGELDYWFYYARDSLLRYADWMLEHEVPYADVLDKVELPTETWPAQDIRKCHVFHLAARCTAGARRAAFAERAAFFFDRCLADLARFETAYLTRPRVLLSVYGHVHAYYVKHGYGTDERFVRAHAYDFGAPVEFLGQRARLAAGLRRRLRVVVDDFRRAAADRVARLGRRA